MRQLRQPPPELLQDADQRTGFPLIGYALAALLLFGLAALCCGAAS